MRIEHDDYLKYGATKDHIISTNKYISWNCLYKWNWESKKILKILNLK